MKQDCREELTGCGDQQMLGKEEKVTLGACVWVTEEWNFGRGKGLEGKALFQIHSECGNMVSGGAASGEMGEVECRLTQTMSCANYPCS